MKSLYLLHAVALGKKNSILLKPAILLKHYIIIPLFMNTWWIVLNRHQNITLAEAQLPMLKLSMKQGHKLAEPHSAHKPNRTDWQTWNWIKDLRLYRDHLQLGNLNKFPFFLLFCAIIYVLHIRLNMQKWHCNPLWYQD